MSKVVLVTGATGNQGGSVIRALQDSDIEILALTRNISSPSAQRLINNSPNIKLIQGDLDNASAIFESAKKVIDKPIWGVFSVQALAAGDASIEETQGKSLIDAAIAANVHYFVYNSVDRGGAKSSSTPTPVASWATKYRIEHHLKQKAAGTGMKYTILRPTAFMEIIKDDSEGKLLVASWYAALKNDKPLQLVAVKDIGWFAANAFLHPDEFEGRELSLVGAELTYAQANKIFREKVGKDMPKIPSVVAHVLLHVVKSLGLMFKWLKEVGPDADIEECRKIHPGLMDFGTWLEQESTFKS